MTLNQSALLELTQMLRTADNGDVMRQMLGFMLQALVDAEATAVIGAAPHQRTEERTTHRNGTRPKSVSTTAGDLTVKIPKLRTGSFFPSLLEPRRRVDVALHAVVMEAYVHGVSTRKVDDLVAALGVDTGISKSEVSRICAGLDEQVAAYDTRPLEHGAFPYVFLDATYCKARLGGRVVSQAVVIATGVSADGRREVLGSQVGDSESKAFWTEFLRGLRERGLAGVQLVISDHHRGLIAAVEQVMAGATWQRCRVHFMRNVLTRVPKSSSAMVATTIRTIFAQPTGPLVREQVEVVATMLERQLPEVAAMLRAVGEEITAFADFPEAHWPKIWSTNPLERLNREVKRRTEVVGIFPNPAALHRLTACVLIEAHDEWQVAECRYLSEGSMALLNPPEPTALTPAPTVNQEVIDTPTAVTAWFNQQSATRRYFHHATGLDPRRSANTMPTTNDHRALSLPPSRRHAIRISLTWRRRHSFCGPTMFDWRR